MSRFRGELSPIPEVGSGPVRDLLLDHFYRGARIQRVLRLLLVASCVATLLAVPPGDGELLSWIIVICYLVWAVVVGLRVSQASAEAAPYVWLALLFDVLATSALTLVADASAQQTWTAYVVINGFFLLPVIAAAQLNPWVCGVVSLVAVLTYLGSSVATRDDHLEPGWALVLRTGLLAVVGLGCALLSALARHVELTGRQRSTSSRICKRKPQLTSRSGVGDRGSRRGRPAWPAWTRVAPRTPPWTCALSVPRWRVCDRPYSP